MVVSVQRGVICPQETPEFSPMWISLASARTAMVEPTLWSSRRVRFVALSGCQSGLHACCVPLCSIAIFSTDLTDIAKPLIQLTEALAEITVLLGRAVAAGAKHLTLAGDLQVEVPALAACFTGAAGATARLGRDATERAGLTLKLYRGLGLVICNTFAEPLQKPGSETSTSATKTQAHK